MVGNRVEVTYARSDLLERRRVPKEQWAEVLKGIRKPAADDPGTPGLAPPFHGD